MKPHRLARFVLTVPFALLLAPSSAQAQVWDPAADFSTTLNPNGAWSYGWSATLGASFNAYVTSMPCFCPPHLDSWSDVACTLPSVWKNNTPSLVACSTGSHPGLTVGLHPGLGGAYSLFRWTAPAAGTCHVAGAYFGVDTVGTTTDVHVLHNSVPVFSGVVTGLGIGTTFSVDLAIQAGDTVDFSVGVGGNGSLNDSTGLNATVDFSAGGGPTVYCTARATSCGSSPTIGGPSGTASLSAGSGSYDVTCGPVPDQGPTGSGPGILIHTPSGQHPTKPLLSFGFLCINPPFIRGPVASAGAGGPLTCDAVFTWDLGAYLAANAGMLGLVPGPCDLQPWYRDPTNAVNPPGGSANFANAMAITLTP